MGIIYCATNLANGKKYIGQTIKTLKHRIKSHISESSCRNKVYFHRAINKYGIDAFKWEVLESCENDKLSEREMYFIALLGTKSPIGYNSTYGGEGCRGFRHTPESKEKLSVKAKQRYKDHPWTPEQIEQRASKIRGLKRSEEFKKNLSNKMMGKKLSQEHKDAVGNANRNRKISEQTRERLHECRSGDKNPRAKTIKCIETGEVFTTVLEASLKYNLAKADISKVAKGTRNICGGFHWEYVSE